MGAQILIEGGENWFEFSKSKTGQLDYVGKWMCDDCDMPRGMQPEVDVSDKDTLSYLVHEIYEKKSEMQSDRCLKILKSYCRLSHTMCMIEIPSYAALKTLKQNSRECVMM